MSPRPRLSSSESATLSRPARVRKTNRVEQNALRAARSAGLGEPAKPPVERSFVTWFLGRVLAIAVLTGAAWAVYDSASSDRFSARDIHVSGSSLLTQSEVESVAAVEGANVFWIDRRAVEARLAMLPSVRRAEVVPVFPDRVEIRIDERQPAGFWVTGDRTYLVDREGVVLKVADSATQSALACGTQACDSRGSRRLPTVKQMDGDQAAAGGRVEPAALGAVDQLATLLPQAGVKPVEFDWSHDGGLEVKSDQPWRLRVDASADLNNQIVALQGIRQYLSRNKRSAELIDVRFGDRPYFR